MILSGLKTPSSSRRFRMKWCSCSNYETRNQSFRRSVGEAKAPTVWTRSALLNMCDWSFFKNVQRFEVYKLTFSPDWLAGFWWNKCRIWNPQIVPFILNDRCLLGGWCGSGPWKRSHQHCHGGTERLLKQPPGHMARFDQTLRLETWTWAVSYSPSQGGVVGMRLVGMWMKVELKIQPKRGREDGRYGRLGKWYWFNLISLLWGL